MDLVITADDPRRDDVHALLAVHLAFALKVTPPEDVHALDVDGLLDPAVSFFSARRQGRLLGVGALRWLTEDHAELKSMHTAQAARGQGVGRAMVEHLLAFAAQRGWWQVSLETGSMEAFAPARELYLRHGFQECPAFGEYEDSPNRTCMTLRLDPPGGGSTPR